MSLISINLPASFLRDFIDLLTRLVNAVDRIAGPDPSTLPVNTPRQSTMADYHNLDDDSQAASRAAMIEFADELLLVPFSTAHYNAMKECERLTREVAGEAGVKELAWKKPFYRPHHDSGL